MIVACVKPQKPVQLVLIYPFSSINSSKFYDSSFKFRYPFQYET
jgi:hypothetical protein